MKQGRVRTESMVERFAKTAIGEGFDLWDRDYLLGAMRLFLFKSETAPPFQVGPCLDATGEILMQMEEYEDASEQFTIAAEKYLLIQQPILSELMQIKVEECNKGPSAALSRLESYIDTQSVSVPTVPAVSAAMARMRAYHADLLLKAATDETEPQLALRAIAAAQAACQQGWDRVHTGHVVLGDALQVAGQLEAARREYTKALEINGNSMAALERLIRLLELSITGAGDDDAQIAQLRKDLFLLLDTAIALHPRSTLLRKKAFLISETSGDAEALAFLDPLIMNPPPEEADAARGVAGQTLATLLKAKAAILADGGNMAEALTVAQTALKEAPKDEEAATIVAEIQQVLAGGGS